MKNLVRLWVFALLAAVSAVVLLAQQPVVFPTAQHVVVDTAPTTAVTGTFWQATQPVSGTVTANMGTVAADPFGANADVASSSGSISAKLRFIAATGIPVTALPANASVNLAQVAGSTAATAATGVAKVGVVGNAGAAIDAATGAAPPANAVQVAGLASGATGGLLKALTACDSDFNIDITTAATTLAVTGVTGRKIHICAFFAVATATDTVALIEGTGATCGTGTAGVVGSATAGHGMAFAANGGMALGAGDGPVVSTATAGDSLCIVTSAATQLAGHLKYAIY